MGAAMSKGILVSALGAALVLTGCGTSSTDTGTSSGNGDGVVTSSATTTSAAGTETGGGVPTAASESAKATPATTTAKAETPAVMWNPCGIADADIARLGFRADSKQVVEGSAGEPSCRWQSTSGKSEVTIVSSRQTLQDLQNSGRYTGFTPVRAAGHDAYQYRAAQDTNKTGCYVSFAVASGQAMFVTRNLKSDAPEPCAATVQVVDGLTGYLN